MDTTTRYCLISLFVLIVILLMALPFASTDPDGLEKVAQNLGFDDKAKDTNTFALMQNYDATGDGNWTGALIAGTVGALAVMCLGFGARRLMKIGEKATGK